MYNARIRTTEVPNVRHTLELNVSIQRALTRSRIRMITAIAGTSLMLIVVAMMPGLLFLVLPGLIAISGKVYDEARLIQYLKYGEPITKEHWEETEAQRERLRTQYSGDRRISVTF